MRSVEQHWEICEALAHAEQMRVAPAVMGRCPRCQQRRVVEVGVPSHITITGDWSMHPVPAGVARIIRYCQHCDTIIHDTGGRPERHV